MAQTTRFANTLRTSRKGILPGAIVLALWNCYALTMEVDFSDPNLSLGSLPLYIAASIFWGGIFGAIMGFLLGLASASKPPNRAWTSYVMRGACVALMLSLLFFVPIFVSDCTANDAIVWLSYFALWAGAGGTVGFFTRKVQS